MCVASLALHCLFMNGFSHNLPKCIIIAGPTASGKTSLSVSLALDLDGEIINADSMQVYRGMDIGTAKPTSQEKRGVPHHLLDVVYPDEAFNAAIYRERALAMVRIVVARTKACFVTGGTGLYIKSLTHGLFDCPPVPGAVREALLREVNACGLGLLYGRLKQLDPASAARIHPNDKVRIMRALEILHTSDGMPSEMIRRHGFSDVALETLKICLHVERKVLYRRIDQRTIHMVDAGLIDETERLLSQGYGPNLKPMTAIGYRHMVRYLQGKWSLDEAVSKMQRDTRRYAKRQLTWFKADHEYIWREADDFDGIKGVAEAFLEK